LPDERGYYVLDCADVDAATGWAATIPAARYGSIEVRPLLEELPR
jgi:hypothetical protein